MIGRMALFVITMTMMLNMLINFLGVVKDNNLSSHLHDYISVYSDRISMEGAISSSGLEEIDGRLRSIGGCDMLIKYSRRIGPGLYEVTTELDDIIDRSLGKGDIINIIISRHGRVLFNKAAYVMVNNQEYTMGFDVIKEIKKGAMAIHVRNRGQSGYIIYDDIFNTDYGDDTNEMPYNEGYIFEYSRYLRRDEADHIVFTEN
jgi:hypothetical protein